MPLSVCDLPDDLLCVIFVIVIYNDDPQDESDLEVERRILLIYRRLFTLIGVCSSWQRLCLSTGSFWSVIPPSGSVRRNLFESAIEPYVERAASSDLHITMVEPQPVTTIDPILQFIKQHGPRIRTFDISRYSHHKTLDFVAYLLKHATPGYINSMSIRTRAGYKYQSNWESSSWFSPTSSNYLLFSQFTESLRTLRLGNFNLDWGHMRFHGLVELRLEAVAIADVATIASFLLAISSAPNLQNLQLVQVLFHQGILPDDQPNELPGVVVSLQNLRLLFLQDINSSILTFILRSIAPGSYRIVISFAGSSKLFSGMLRIKSLDLRGLNIDTLILSGSRFFGWRFHAVFQSLLHAMPTIKSLCIRDCSLDQTILQTLARRPEPATGPGDICFPIISRLHIVDTEFNLTALDKLKKTITCHGIQELRLGRILGYAESASSESGREWEESYRWPFGNLVGDGYTPPKVSRQWVRFESPEDDLHTGSIKHWLQANVPDFAVVRRLNELPGTEFRMQLW